MFLSKWYSYYANKRKEDYMKKTYKIEVDCANCAAKAENAINKISGVESAVVSFMAQKLTVVYENGSNENLVLKEIKKTCKKVDSDIEIS